MRGAAGEKGIIISVGGTCSGACACCNEGDMAVKDGIHAVDGVEGCRWTPARHLSGDKRAKAPALGRVPHIGQPRALWGESFACHLGRQTWLNEAEGCMESWSWIKVISFATPDGWHLNGLASQTLDPSCLMPRVPEQGSRS